MSIVSSQHSTDRDSSKISCKIIIQLLYLVMLEGKQLSYSIAILIFTYFRRFRCSANFRGSKISSFVLSSFPPKFSCIVIIRVFRMLAIRVDTRYYRGGISGQRKLQHQYRTYVRYVTAIDTTYHGESVGIYLISYGKKERRKKEWTFP